MCEVPTCPDAEALQRFLLGQDTPGEAAAIEEHLESCEQCLELLTSLPAADRMVEALQAHSKLTDVCADVGVQLLVEWLKKLPHRGDALPPLSTPGNAPGSRAGENLTRLPDGLSTVSFEFLAPAQSPTEMGRLGPYRVQQVLGAGGMGVVFKAYDPDLDRFVALKTLLPAQATLPRAKQRFLREGRAAAALKHDHIVTIYQVGEDRNVAFLAMEYLEGESLAQRLNRDRQLPLPEVLRIAGECAAALTAAHSKGLIHRDIKPGNIWLERSDGQAGLPRVKLLDFGLALPPNDDAHLTQEGALVGTPAFMAPEQLRGETVDARADLFSLGCVLYRMATGEEAFKGTHVVSTLIAVATTNPRPPQELNPELPLALCELIVLLLAKSPNERPPTALAVGDALRAIAQGEQTEVARAAPSL